MSLIDTIFQAFPRFVFKLCSFKCSAILRSPRLSLTYKEYIFFTIIASSLFTINFPSLFIWYPKGGFPNDLPCIALFCIDSFILLLLFLDTPGASKCKNAFWRMSGKSSSRQKNDESAFSAFITALAIPSKSKLTCVASGITIKYPPSFFSRNVNSFSISE